MVTGLSSSLLSIIASCNEEDNDLCSIFLITLSTEHFTDGFQVSIYKSNHKGYKIKCSPNISDEQYILYLLWHGKSNYFSILAIALNKVSNMVHKMIVSPGFRKL